MPHYRSLRTPCGKTTSRRLATAREDDHSLALQRRAGRSCRAAVARESVGLGRRRKAARWRCSHPRVDARVGEGPCGGTAPSSGHLGRPVATSSHSSCGIEREGRGREYPRVLGRSVTPGFLKNKTRLIICVPRKSTHMSE
jgi:hypothetical protein